MHKNKKRILVAPEYAMSDLAESHRMSSIAKAFLDQGHEVYILGKTGKYGYLFKNTKYKFVEIPFDNEWMTEEKFNELHNLDVCGMGFLTLQELEKFVAEELNIINKIKPDVVITGFRPTLNVSTKVAKVPLVWILSGAVSDLYFDYELMTMPHGFSTDIKIAKLLFRFISREFFFAVIKHLFIMPRWYKVWNKVLTKYSLPKFRTMMGGFKGDFNLMSDAKELFPEFEEIPSYYGFCGPLLPEMNVKMPISLKNFKKKKNRPVIFLSMGSSGEPEIFKNIIYSFKDKPYDVFVATTTIIKKKDLEFIPDNIIIEEFFPAIELTKLSDVVIIHGGQGTVYTTIIGGAPFVGIPMFNEQQWNLENVARNGCGIIIPRPKLDVNKIQEAIEEILKNKEYKENMISLQKKIKKYAEDKKYYPPKIAVEKIIDFLDNKRESYFTVKGY